MNDWSFKITNENGECVEITEKIANIQLEVDSPNIFYVNFECMMNHEEYKELFNIFMVEYEGNRFPTKEMKYNLDIKTPKFNLNDGNFKLEYNAESTIIDLFHITLEFKKYCIPGTFEDIETRLEDNKGGE